MACVFFIHDLTGKILFGSDEPLCQGLLLGHEPWEWMPSEDAERVRMAFARAVMGEVVEERCSVCVNERTHRVRVKYAPCELQGHRYVIAFTQMVEEDFERLSAREVDILQRFPTHSIEEISHMLHISVATVRSHKQHIMEKLELANTNELIEFATRHTCFENFPMHPIFFEHGDCPNCAKPFRPA